MPKAMLDKLPKKAKERYEEAWQDAKEKGWDDARAAAYAIGAVKQAGFTKNEDTGMWTKASEPIWVLFGESVEEAEWLEVACTGTVVDMKGSHVSISEQDFEEWVQAFEDNKRGQDIPITYDHPKSGGMAAGWVRGLRLGPKREIMGKTRSTLLMNPKWTPRGRQSVEDRDYQYFSVEILPDNQLRAISMVNFPAIKGLHPATVLISLGEVPMYFLKEFIMPEKKEVKKLLSKCPECGAPIPEGSKACPVCGAEIEEKETVPVAEKQKSPSPKAEGKLSELQVQLDKLSEQRATQEAALTELREAREREEEERKALTELVEGQDKQIQGLIDLNNMLRLHEKVGDFMALAETPNKQIAPAYEDQIIEVLQLAESPEVEADILKLLKAFAVGDAVVEFGERGTGSVPDLDTGEDVDHSRLDKAAEKLAEEKGIPYKTALLELSRKEVK